ADRLHLHLLERLPLERRERLRHLGGAVGERAAARQPPEGLERRLLALRAVQSPDPAAAETELEQLLERLRLLLAQLALLDRGDEIGEPPPALRLLDEREHRLRLAQRDLGRLSAQRDRHV